MSNATNTTNPKDAIGLTKPRLDLIPPALTLHVSQAMADGAVKYGAFNWRERAVRLTVYIAAAQRHLLELLDGEDTARDSGHMHAAHVAACMAIILDAFETGNLVDDRPKKGCASNVIERLTKRPEAPAVFKIGINLDEDAFTKAFADVLAETREQVMERFGITEEQVTEYLRSNGVDPESPPDAPDAEEIGATDAGGWGEPDGDDELDAPIPFTIAKREPRPAKVGDVIRHAEGHTLKISQLYSDMAKFECGSQMWLDAGKPWTPWSHEDGTEIAPVPVEEPAPITTRNPKAVVLRVGDIVQWGSGACEACRDGVVLEAETPGVRVLVRWPHEPGTLSHQRGSRQFLTLVRRPVRIGDVLRDTLDDPGRTFVATAMHAAFDSEGRWYHADENATPIEPPAKALDQEDREIAPVCGAV